MTLLHWWSYFWWYIKVMVRSHIIGWGRKFPPNNLWPLQGTLFTRDSGGYRSSGGNHLGHEAVLRTMNYFYRCQNTSTDVEHWENKLISNGGHHRIVQWYISSSTKYKNSIGSYTNQESIYHRVCTMHIHIYISEQKIIPRKVEEVNMHKDLSLVIEWINIIIH